MIRYLNVLTVLSVRIGLCGREFKSVKTIDENGGDSGDLSIEFVERKIRKIYKMAVIVIRPKRHTYTGRAEWTYELRMASGSTLMQSKPSWYPHKRDASHAARTIVKDIEDNGLGIS